MNDAVKQVKKTQMELRNEFKSIEPKDNKVIAKIETQPGKTLHERAAPSRTRFLLFSVTLIAALGISGYVFWLSHASDTETAKAAQPITRMPTDLVIADENQMKQIAVEPVGERSITIDRDTTGKVGFNEDRQTPVFTPYAGRALEVLANKGQNVRAGQPLLIIESADLVAVENDLSAARTDLGKAKIGLQIAQTAAERARRLHAAEAVATRDVQQAEADLLRAQGDQSRAQAAIAVVEGRLALFGKRADEIARLNNRVDNRLVIRAPISGTIVDRKIGVGQYVKPDAPDPLFLIADLSVLWIQADVYESDLANVRVGESVSISVPAYPNRDFKARISFISPTEDSATRTVRVRCIVQNAGGPNGLMLKPDMFAKIKIGAAAQQRVAVIPSIAVITQRNDLFVFVEESPGHFRKRSVKIGHEKNGFVTINSGVRPGERIVTRGALLINEIKQES